jgi:hypothetical protein
MKKSIVVLCCSLLVLTAYSQSSKISFSFLNDQSAVYPLNLFFYTPDGNGQTRVTALQSLEAKTYTLPEGSTIYVATKDQVAFAMKGNDIRTAGTRPLLMLKKEDTNKIILISSLRPLSQVRAGDALGNWIIDLRPAPDSEPYLKDFKFTSIDSNRFDGEFYGYPFSGGFLNTDWDKVYFAFTTQDQSGTYFHSGFIEGNKVNGITLNENRQFLLPWKGERKLVGNQ